MPEVIAGELAVGGATSFAEYGLAFFAIAGLLFLIHKFGLRWVEWAQGREERDANIRKGTYEALNGISAALNANTEAAQHQVSAINRLSESVGRLPCTHRDPTLRTRDTD